VPTDIDAELEALLDMTTGELADLYRELHGIGLDLLQRLAGVNAPAASGQGD